MCEGSCCFILLLFLFSIYFYICWYHLVSSVDYVCDFLYAAILGILANLIRDGGQQAESIQLKKASRWNLHPAKSSVDIEVEAVNNGNGNHGPLADDIKLKREKNVSTSFSSVDKVIFFFNYCIFTLEMNLLFSIYQILMQL